MPIRPYLNNPGFDNPARPEPLPLEPETATAAAMKPLDFGGNFQRNMESLKDSAATWGAAMEIENPVLNTWELLNEPVFGFDPNFNLEANLREAGLWEDHRWQFLGVGDAAHFLFKARKIQREKAARERLAAAGADGVVASILAGAASPTILLPFVGVGVKGAQAVATGLAWGAVGGLIDEVPLQLNQELRTLEESAIAITASTVLGGVLGGGVGWLNGRLDRISEDMAISPNEPYISPSDAITRAQDELAALDPDDVDYPTFKSQLEARIEELKLDAENARLNTRIEQELEGSAIGTKAAAGADILEDVTTGRLKNMLGIGERLTKVAGPVTAVLGSLSAKGRQMMAELSVAGLRREGNVILSKGQFDENGKLIPGTQGKVIGGLPSNHGGTAESIILSRQADLLNAIYGGYKNYADYWYGKNSGPALFRQSRAAGSGQLKAGHTGKLTRRQFFEEVGKAMISGDESAIPEVAATAKLFRQHYDGLLKEAQNVGVISSELEELTPDLSYLNRIYDTDMIDRNPVKFKRILEQHFKEVLQGELARAHDGFVKADARDAQRLADMDLPLPEARALKARFENELKALDNAEDDEYVWLQEMINDQRSLMRQISRERKTVEKQLASTSSLKLMAPLRERLAELNDGYRQARAEAERLDALGGADLEAKAQRRRDLKARIRNLNRSRYMVEEKYRAKYDKIDELEEQNIEALNRIVGQGQRTLRALDTQDAKLGDELRKLQVAVNRAGMGLTKLDGQLGELQERALKANAKEGEVPTEGAVEEAKVLTKIFSVEERRAAQVDKLSDAWDELATFENINWVERGADEARGAIQDILNQAVERVNKTNTARSKRMAALEKQAEKFDAEAWAAKRTEIVERVKVRREKLMERAHEMGADGYDPKAGPKADFSQRAAEISEIARDRITGVNVRLAGFDALNDKRGLEMARMLSISSKPLQEAGFLVTDAEQLIKAYHNTLVPDIEIVNKFGPYAPDGEINIHFKELNEEYDRTVEAVEKKYADEAAKSGKPVDEAAKQAEMKGLAKEYALIRENLDVTIRRLRGQFGIPKNPDGWAARGVSTALALTGMRFLGMAAWSSLSDVARPIMRYGLLRSLRTGFLPFITNLKAVRMTYDDARRAYVAVESFTAYRAFMLMDLANYARKRSKFEAGIEWGASKMSLLAGFGPWSDAMKVIGAMVTNSKIMDSIDIAMNGAKTEKARLEAVEFLNSIGMSGDIQRRIWNEMQNGGGRKFGDTWVPQTDAWTDAGAKKTYRAALYAESASTIITPGVEKAKIADSSLTGRMFFSLKSFALASTSKTLLAGLQQRDMAFFNGAMIMIALGMLSVYLKAQIAGGAALERMESLSFEQWVDEGLNASGILGALSIGQELASNIPYARSLTSVSGASQALQGNLSGDARSARSRAAGLVEDIAGAGNSLVFDLAAIMTNLDDVDRAQVHRVRELLPLQNLFLLRRIFDQIENSVGDTFNLEGTPR